MWLVVLASFGLFHQLALAKACQLEDNPSNVAMIVSSDVVIIYFIDTIFMGVEVSLVALLGSLIVMMSIIVLLRSKNAT